MVRQLYNPKQIKETQMYYFPGNNRVGGHYIGPFKKKDGYFFSDDKEMDDIVNFFIKQGFKTKQTKKTISAKINEQEDKNNFQNKYNEKIKQIDNEGKK